MTTPMAGEKKTIGQSTWFIFQIVDLNVPLDGKIPMKEITFLAVAVI